MRAIRGQNAIFAVLLALGSCSTNSGSEAPDPSGAEPTSGTGGASADGSNAPGSPSGGSVSVGGSSAASSAIATGGVSYTGGTGGTTGAPTGGQSTGDSSGPSADPIKSLGCGKTPTLTSGDNQAISVSGTERIYNLRVPDDYDNSHPYRLIVSYHAGNGTADQVSGVSWVGNFYGLWDLAQGSTIFVAPQGLNKRWSNSGGADVELSRQLITLIENEFCVDRSRIFCEGFSMGGSMSYAMACAMGDVVRGVAVHSGGPMSGCTQHDKPVAYFMTHGTDDGELAYPGYGVPELQDFAKTNGCTSPDPTLSEDAFAQTMPTPTDSSGATPACIDLVGCNAGYPARACIFVGGHTPLPGAAPSWVPAETWAFLSQF